jgi:hypothetical protein
MSEQNTSESINDSAIPDASKFKRPEEVNRGALDPLEKEEREAAKKLAKPAPKGAYICTGNILSDNKSFKRGDEYEGKLYADLIASKSIVTKEEWAKR